jgi:ATP-binding cassette subfamily B protein
VSIGRDLPFPSRPFAFTAWVVRRFTPKRALLLFAITVLATALQALTPYLVGRFVDTLDAVLGQRADAADVHRLFALLILAWLVGPLIARLYTAANAFTMPRMRAEIDRALFAWTLRQSAPFFEDRLAGALTQQIRKAGQAAPNLFECFVLPFARIAVMMLAAAVLLWTALPAYTVAFAVFTAVFVAVSLVMARHAGRVIARLAEARSAVSGRIADALGGQAVVRSFSGTDHEIRGLHPLIEREYMRGRNARFAFTAMRLSQLVLSVGFMSALLWFALEAALAGRLTGGDIAMMLTIGVQLSVSITDLGDDILACFEYVGDLQESLDALASPAQVVDAPGAPALTPRAGTIRFRDVRFSYPSGDPVFDGFSLAISGGERVGIAGHSGAGKSTLLRLLMRHYDVTGGSILVDGADIRDVAQDSLRRCVAEVSQNIELFHRSILDNIRYGRPDAGDDEVIAAARAAHCHDFISARPGGYATVVGERGVKLSGGERQRIGIARALLKNAPILLLDEATAALDSESEHLIQSALARLMRGRTVIAIAHRLSTIAHMDRIVVLQAGRIVQQGTHDRLLGVDGPYKALWRRQQHGHGPVRAQDAASLNRSI